MVVENKSISLNVVGREAKKLGSYKEEKCCSAASLSVCFRATANMLHRPTLVFFGLLPIIASFVVDTEIASKKVFHSSDGLFSGLLSGGLLITGASNLTAMAFMWSDGLNKAADVLGVTTAASVASVVLFPNNPYVWAALAGTLSAGAVCQLYSICAARCAKAASAPGVDLEAPAPGESSYVQLESAPSKSEQKSFTP